jgi:hypothetical protein
MVEAFAPALEKASDTGRVVGRLDELDLRLTDGQERDPDAIRGDVHDGFKDQAELVPVEPKRLVDRSHDDRNVMDSPESWQVGPGRWHSA